MNKSELICGNNIEVLKRYPDNSVDAIVTDPPYGLGDEPNANEMLKAWLDHGYLEVNGKGFMGRSWDAFVPQPLFWKEAFRVLKPGGHVLSFFGTRTYDWGVMAMRLAGFEIRESLYWHHGSGFPKSHNVSKAIDAMAGVEREGTGIMERGGNREARGGDELVGSIPNEEAKWKEITIPATEEAKRWDGWGSALKPATEPIVLARKPLEKGLTIADNVLKWGTGAINIDGCRISTTDNLNGGAYSGGQRSEGDWKENSGFKNDKLEQYQQPNGRFPANVILSHSDGCKCVGTKKVKGSSCSPDDIGKGTENTPNNGILGKGKGGVITSAYTDENGEETVEDWECVDDCPVKILDEQSGITKSGKVKSDKLAYNGDSVTGFLRGVSNSSNQHGDSGGASRFFYVAKASRTERNWGLDDFEDKEMARSVGAQNDIEYPKDQIGLNKTNIVKNTHPTIKPVQLMRYLVRLVTPPGGLVLDPFNGSGTTGIACKLEGFDYIGIDREQEYIDISRGRIDNWVDELDVMVERKIKENKKNKTQLGLGFEFE